MGTCQAGDEQPEAVTGTGDDEGFTGIPAQDVTSPTLRWDNSTLPICTGLNPTFPGTQQHRGARRDGCRC